MQMIAVEESVRKRNNVHTRAKNYRFKYNNAIIGLKQLQLKKVTFVTLHSNACKLEQNSELVVFIDSAHDFQPRD